MPQVQSLRPNDTKENDRCQKPKAKVRCQRPNAI